MTCLKHKHYLMSLIRNVCSLETRPGVGQAVKKMEVLIDYKEIPKVRKRNTACSPLYVDLCCGFSCMWIPAWGFHACVSQLLVFMHVHLGGNECV